jgi:hypothetical protein
MAHTSTTSLLLFQHRKQDILGTNYDIILSFTSGHDQLSLKCGHQLQVLGERPLSFLLWIHAATADEFNTCTTVFANIRKHIKSKCQTKNL